MYYYAFLNAEDICTMIYEMPAPISGNQFIAISSNDQTLIGKHFNRTTMEFEAVYYYAILDSRNVVTSVTYNTVQQATSATMLSITFAQYQTVTGLYWNGTEFVTPPISVLAVASTNEVNYKDQEKWLSTKLDEMDAAIGFNATDISAISANLGTVVTALQTVSNNLAALSTAVEGKANATHSHAAADLSGVVKTVNGNAPDAEGNITITNSGMTAAEILESLKTVDGTGSGIDADTLDGLDSTAFALANHNHDTVYAPAAHTHNEYLTASALTGYATTEAVNSALSGKADSTHTHDEYALQEHTHTGYATTSDLNAVSAALDNKADTNHSHAISDVAGLQSALNGKADSSHTHSGYLPTSGGTVSGNLNVGGILRVNNQQAIYDSGTMITLSTNNRETMIAGSKIYSKVQISVSSDERLKENITAAPTDALAEMIDKLNVKTYSYIGSDEENVGIIAQELIRDNPTVAEYFVRTDDKGYYSVKAADLVFPLIAAVQKLNREVNELKK